MALAMTKPETEAQQVERLNAQYGHLDGGVKALPKLVLGLQRVRDATEGRHEVLAPQPAPPTVFLCERCGLCS